MNKDSFFTFLPVSYVVTQAILEKHTKKNLQLSLLLAEINAKRVTWGCFPIQTLSRSV